MPIPARGEVSFQALGERWTFFFGFNAICAAEDEFDLPFISIIGEILPGATGENVTDPGAVAQIARQMRFGNVRRMLRFGLVEHHDDMTDKVAGSIIDDLGLPAVTELLGKGLAQALADDSEETAANPPKPRRKR